MLNQLKHSLLALLRGKKASQTAGGAKRVEWYDEYYRESESYALPYWDSHYYFLWSVIADRIRTAGLRRVLDIGCGSGQLAACLFDLASIDEYVGLDFSAEAVAMARRACPRAHFVVGDARRSEIHTDVPHDVIVCTEVLEHVPEDHEVIGAFTPGKRCICTVPNFPWESHVRSFADEREVVERYGSFFGRLDVQAMPRSASQVFYLMDGVRNSFRYVGSTDAATRTSV